MKKFSVWLIRLYQNIPGPWHSGCRYYPTCSNYAIQAINNYGFFKGWILAIKRILKCNPLGGSGYDPVPLKRKKEESEI